MWEIIVPRPISAHLRVVHFLLVAARRVGVGVLDLDGPGEVEADHLAGELLDVGGEGELALELGLVLLDLLEGHVDDGDHHVDQHQVHGH